ncbi:MAG: DUF1491 domain-containing protein [Sphingomonas hengshuiensis]|nr:MAG: DUF1491 domain-containing protein [Sphingomonas hengshuiensis]
MSTARVSTHLIVSALLRRVNDAGGMAVVLARGDADAGAVLMLVSEQGRSVRVLERGVDAAGHDALIVTGIVGDSAATDPHLTTDYWQRRRARDPDLWVIELDIVQAERFAAQILGLD